ncbi:MAG: NTP transferase domain-containing protein [Muribaculaceae bacterium]|nr:NTP transferase domain-containing protein [Muribaculaceae bacterium]MBR3100711.1 NTP transferase domain-containing protein [Muribaculaceae bacterium]
MNYAIIAAGEGSRLAQEGVKRPKPLVLLNGEPMIGRLINIFLRCNAESISIIVNEQMTEVQDYLRALRLPVPLNIVVKSTPSSMHSFAELTHVMQPGKFCMTTVDTIFREEDFARYVQAFEDDTVHDGMWAVTPFVDDEKPLWVEVDGQMGITAFLDRNNDGRAHLVSGGIYAMTDKAWPVLYDCLDRGVARMRNFQRALVAAGFRLQAYSIDKIVDVDHAGDIATAEKFIKG